MSRVAKGLSIVAGGAVSDRSGPAYFNRLPKGLGERWSTPAPPGPTLCELFAASPRDSAWAGFLLAQVEAGAVGPGADGDPRIGADPSARARPCRNPSRRGARRPLGAVGDGGRRKMRRPLRSDRRVVRRPGGARLHRDSPAGGRLGARPGAVLAGSARRPCEFERRADALAAGERAVARQSARCTGAGAAGLGCRAVPLPRSAARPLEHRP